MNQGEERTITVSFPSPAVTLKELADGLQAAVAAEGVGGWEVVEIASLTRSLGGKQATTLRVRRR